MNKPKGGGKMNASEKVSVSSGKTKKTDITGHRFGSLTAVEPTERRKNGYTVWRCRCDCGKEIELDTRCIKRGTVTDCGCRTVVKPGQKDVTGQRFGKLTALYPLPEHGYGNTLWHCRCDCGNEIDAPLHQLTIGHRKSCGCIRYMTPEGETILKDFVGKRFGQLVVMEYAGKRAGMHRWRCVCDCGNETVVGQTLLQSGKTKSCGCIKQSQIFENMKFVENTSVAALEARMNRPPISTNNSGYNGVHLGKSGKWVAQIGFQGKKYHLGTFDRIEDAIDARKQGEKMYDDFLSQYYSENPST